MFDAGTIEASLIVQLDEFNRDLDKAEERVRQFTSKKHEVKISAVFDTASLTHARKMFADLDQQVSRDAAMRLRTSPQGSVLGSLNALFSPHPVTGSPTAQQAGQQGLLGRMMNTPGGGGGTPGPASAPSQQAPGPSPGGGSGGGGDTHTSSASQQPRNARGQFTSAGGSGGGSGGGNDHQTNNMLLHLLGAIFGGGDGGGGAGSGGGGGFFKKLGSAAGPGILGISAKRATQVGVGASLLGALPALIGPLAALGVGGAGAGVLALGAKQLIGTQQAPGKLYNPAQAALGTLQSGLQTATQPLIKPLEQAFKQIPSLVKGLTPALTQLFAGASTLIQPFLQGITELAKDVLPGLGQAFRTVAPLMEPFLSSIGQLFKNLLPGLLSLLKAVQPILGTLEGVLGNVGSSLGELFASLAPVMKPASVLLKALLDLVLAFLPIIGQLASIFATSLAPAFQLFAGLLKQLTPVLVPIGKILAELAGAVLGDLVGILQPLVQLIGQLAPSFAVLGKALGDVFNTLENAGIFQVLGDALENVAGPLATFINMLVSQLAPFIPPLLQIVQSLIDAGINVFTTAILSLIPALTQIVQALLPPLLKLLIILTPTISQLAGLMARGLGDAIVGIVDALTPLLVLLAKIITGTLNWLQSTHLLLPVLVVLLAFLAPIPTAIALIGLAIGYLAEHWHRIWGDIKQWTLDAWHAVDSDVIQPMERFFTKTIPRWFDTAINFLYNNFVHPFKTGFDDAWSWVKKNVFDPIYNFMTVTVPGWFDTAVKAIKSVWNTVEDVFKTPVNFLIGTVYDNGIKRFWNDVMNAIGLGSLDLPNIATLAAGGKIMTGSGPQADDVLIRASRGETVVSAADSAILAPLFAMLGIPGYAGGGVVGDLGGIVTGLITGGTGKLTDALMKLIGVPSGTAGSLVQMVTGIPKKIISSAVHWAASSFTGLLGGGSTAGAYGSGQPVANAAMAKLLYPAWAVGQPWIDWNYVATRESGWSNTALNPASDAFGIAQALPFTKMPKAAWPASAGGRADPATQIMWMVGYILSRYGSPAGAAAHELQYNWYGRGLNAIFDHPTMIGVGESGPEAVSVTPLASLGSRSNPLTEIARQMGAGVHGDKLDRIAALLGSLINATRAVPRGVSDNIGAAMGTSAQNAMVSQRYPSSR